jgi:hypothetical protein
MTRLARSLSLSLALSLSLSLSVARAQDTDADHAAALAMMQAGIDAAQDGDWDAARVAFERAYSLVASTRVLMNLAGAQRHTGRLLEATASYQQWLADATARDEPYRADVEQALQELTTETPQVRVRVAGVAPGDVVRVDGDQIPAGSAVALDPGDHVATVERGGETLATERFSLAPSEYRELDLSVPSLEPETTTTTTARTSIFAQRETAPQDDVLSSPWLWVGVGAGAALVIGIIIGVAVAASGGAPGPDTGTLGTFRL